MSAGHSLYCLNEEGVDDQGLDVQSQVGAALSVATDIASNPDPSLHGTLQGAENVIVTDKEPLRGGTLRG